MKQEIEIPDGFTYHNTFYGGERIIVSIRKVKPKFKMGDVLTNGLQIWIRDVNGDAIILLDEKNIWLKIAQLHFESSNEPRYANYEERCKFFEAIVNAGYKWNSKKYKLSKVEPKPKFESGDIIVVENPRYGNYTILYLGGDLGRPGSLNVGGSLGIYGIHRGGRFNINSSDTFRHATEKEQLKFLEEMSKSPLLVNKNVDNSSVNPN